MSALPRHQWTEAEYLAFERDSDARHEYYRGEIYDMAGAGDDLNTLAMNTAAAIHAQIRKRPCRVYQSEMRVVVPQVKLYTYPDIVVVCGERQFTDDKPDTLINPTILGEVLSPSTQIYDRNEKSEHYRTIESLQEYLLIWQDKIKIEHYVKNSDGGWRLYDIVAENRTIELTSIQCQILVADIYEKIDFDAAE